MFGSQRQLTFKGLRSGGLITNYNCHSRCGHCLYACGPKREKTYIDRKTAELNFTHIARNGCRAVHIGGGEPFLDVDGLRVVLETAREMNILIEYVETNSAWFRDLDSARKILRPLKDLGLSTLLVSISPFHNEYIPLSRVKGVIRACRDTGLNIFPWIGEFMSEAEAFDDTRPHSLAEYENRYGLDYLKKIPSRYWINFGGRAVTTFRRVFENYSWADILQRNKGGCRDLEEVGHFHADLYGNYIPGLCSGLAVRIEDLGGPLDPEKYPLLTTLHREGVTGLFELARSGYGFQPGREYLNKCDLCQDIRRYLSVDGSLDSPELSPRDFYSHLE